MIPFREAVQERARARQRIIVFPEGDDARTLEAVARLQLAGLVRPLVIGDPETVRRTVAGHGADADGVDVVAHEADARFDVFAHELHTLRAAKGWSEADAREKLRDPLVFGAALVRAGHAHGSVAGASRTTGDVLRAAGLLHAQRELRAPCRVAVVIAAHVAGIADGAGKTAS